MQRNRHDAWLTGVCGGIGAHVGVGAGWVRLAFIVASLSGGFGVLLYALAWVVMPLEPTPDASDEVQVFAASSWAFLLPVQGQPLCFFWGGGMMCLASTESSFWRQPS